MMITSIDKFLDEIREELKHLEGIYKEGIPKLSLLTSLNKIVITKINEAFKTFNIQESTKYISEDDENFKEFAYNVVLCDRTWKTKENYEKAMKETAEEMFSERCKKAETAALEELSKEKEQEKYKPKMLTLEEFIEEIKKTPQLHVLMGNDIDYESKKSD
jgi:hypothetical protein